MKQAIAPELLEDMDARTSDQQMHDIKEANNLRASAERFERRGQPVTASLFRNAAWCLENNTTWYQQINAKEIR